MSGINLLLLCKYRHLSSLMAGGKSATIPVQFYNIMINFPKTFTVLNGFEIGFEVVRVH